MTPLWRSYAKFLARNYSAGSMPEIERRFLQVPRAFDLTGVTELCRQVWMELFEGGDRPGSDIFDLGERTAIPCEHMWLEFEHNAFLVETCIGPDSGIFLVSELLMDENGAALTPMARIEHAGDLFEVGPAAECPDDMVLDGWQAAGWVLGALAVLNSPRARIAVDKTHKLLGNKYPAGRNPALRVTTIYIDIGGHNVRGSGLGRSYSPRAYHFVRSHIRRLDTGSTTVRAHWRGDPAFGIRIGVYAVRDRRPQELVH